MAAPVTAALVALAAGAVSAQSGGVLDESLIDEQRALFLEVYESAERGDWEAVWALSPEQRERLADYVLWPDLRAAYLRATLDQAATEDVDAYLEEYGVLKPARELRYRYALSLAARNDIDGFLDVYDTFYRGREIARLDCIALGSEIETGDPQSVVVRARDLWLVPRSQVDECDPLFDKLKERGLLNEADFRRRYDLAVDARNFTLARWLGKSIDDAHATEARRWLAAQSDPGRFVEQYSSAADEATTRRQLVYAVERLTYADPERALELWTPVRTSLPFTQEQTFDTDRHIALWTARDRLDGAYELLAGLDPDAVDTEVLRWRARISIREAQWERLIDDIGVLSEAERGKEQWRYWHAFALDRTGNADAAGRAFAALSVERSYYGFLAADAVDSPYALDGSERDIDAAVIDRLARRQDLLRARELYRVGLDGRGRSEWDSAVRRLTDDEKYHAAVLAGRWDWHSRAIATVASIGEYDALNLRYPLPYRDAFEQHAGEAAITTTWAYGIARSESLFMRDVRSRAGAVGLMQLMPATGSRIARAIDLPYQGLDTLIDPGANIRLGTTYLGQMAERFGGNTILATAAYNAGPHRVDAWMPAAGTMDAKAWIENIPFNETRRYVRRVVTAETIFHWRMTGALRRLSDVLEPIDAGGERVASR